MALYKGKEPLTDVEAQIVGEELERLGNFSPHDVVRVAENPKSVLHKYFEWDEEKAAYRYRLTQARQLVERVKIVVMIDGNKHQTRAFHSVTVKVDTDSREPRYVPLRTIRKSALLRDQVLKQALKELDSWSTRYRQYETVLGNGLFEEIDGVLKAHAIGA